MPSAAHLEALTQKTISEKMPLVFMAPCASLCSAFTTADCRWNSEHTDAALTAAALSLPCITISSTAAGEGTLSTRYSCTLLGKARPMDAIICKCGNGEGNARERRANACVVDAHKCQGDCCNEKMRGYRVTSKDSIGRSRAASKKCEAR